MSDEVEATGRIDEDNLPKFGRKFVNPNEVASLLLSLARALDEKGRALDKLEEDFVHTAEAHNVARTAAFLKARAEKDGDGKNNPQYVCEMIADNETAEERLAMNVEQAKIKAHKRSIEILKERIDVGRTASATLRAELQLDSIPRQR